MVKITFLENTDTHNGLSGSFVINGIGVTLLELFNSLSYEQLKKLQSRIRDEIEFRDLLLDEKTVKKGD
ncbi:MAG: hypothetical protein QXU98_13300 [Candidatus Parvarchaeota archaeon]